MTKRTDPLRDTLRTALREDLREDVRAVLAEVLPDIVDQIRAADTAKVEVVPLGPSMIKMGEMCQRLKCSRQTVLRKEAQGKIPSRRVFPCGTKAWHSDDVQPYFECAKKCPPMRSGHH